MIGVNQQVETLSAALNRQQQVLDQAPSFLAVLRGPDHFVEFANDSFKQLMWPRSCEGLPLQKVFPRADELGLLAPLDEVYRTGKPYRVKDHTLEFTQSSGIRRRIVLSFQYVPMRDGQDAITGVFVEGMDVTYRAEAEAALEAIRQAAERRWAELEVIYQSAPVGLALLGAERLEFRRVNRVQASFYDLPPEQLLGKTIQETTPGVADALALLFRVAGGEEIRDVELRGELPGRPGVPRSWLVSYSPMRLPDGRVDAIICTALETTELRQAERVAHQNEKLAAVGRLAASIAHEINNPLEAVTNLLYLAKDGESLDQAREYIELAESELRRVSAITTQTLRFHRQSSDARAVACDDLLGSALAIYQGRLTSANVAILKRKRAHRPVVCFDGEIRQVLNNLVGNATDAVTTTGGRLLLRSREGTDWRTGRAGLWLTVADTGPGMSAETKKRAFEAFYTTKGIGGTGLGLWISRDIVGRHQGRIVFRSSKQPGSSGTVMSIFLPYATARR